MPPNLYKREGVWYARVKVHGKDQRRSLRTGSKPEALIRLRKILNDVDHARRTGEELHPWKTVLVEWTASMKAAVKPSVLSRYLTSLNNVRDVVEDLNVEDINTKTIAEIVRTRRGAGATNATIKRDLTAVSSMLIYSCAQGWLEENVAKAYDRSVIRERRHVIVLPDPADIDAYVAFAPKMFGRLVRLAQYTGMRQGEIETLEWTQVRKDVIDLWKTKTDRPRAVPIDPRARGTLDGTEKHSTEPWVFHHHGGQPYVGTKSQYRDLMSRAIKAEKVKRWFRFHDLRHWYAVDYLRGGGNIYDLQQNLGHASITTTERYLAFLTPEEARRAKFGVAAQMGHKYTGLAQQQTTEDAG